MGKIDFIKITTGMFIMLNPFVLIPVFLSLTGDATPARRKKIAVTCAVAVFIIMTISVFTGEKLLYFFGITVADFRIAGGILILLMALNMARAQHEGMRYSPQEHEEAMGKADNIAVVPLAIPLMAGPAAMCTAVIYAGDCNTIETRSALIAIIGALCAILWISMLLADHIGRILGTTGQQILKRIMGLILLAMAVEFIVAGVGETFRLHVR
ncbi:MAG: MarC family protein [Thermodesulfobacteriota bacterium]